MTIHANTDPLYTRASVYGSMFECCSQLSARTWCQALTATLALVVRVGERGGVPDQEHDPHGASAVWAEQKREEVQCATREEYVRLYGKAALASRHL